jgi:prepilin-type N-terminal cleavage/methylation domain-containing protein
MSSRDRWGRLQAARWRGDRGVTLVEATIVLTVAAILAAAAAPVASRTLDRAKLARAADDTKAIKTAIDNFIVEFIGFTPFTTTGAAGGATVQLLVGDGDTPRTLGAGGAAQWDDPVNPAAAQPVDFLERHIASVHDRRREPVARVVHQRADRSRSVGQPLCGQLAASADDDDQRRIRAVGRSR